MLPGSHVMLPSHGVLTESAPRPVILTENPVVIPKNAF